MDTEHLKMSHLLSMYGHMSGRMQSRTISEGIVPYGQLDRPHFVQAPVLEGHKLIDTFNLIEFYILFIKKLRRPCDACPLI